MNVLLGRVPQKYHLRLLKSLLHHCHRLFHNVNNPCIFLYHIEMRCERFHFDGQHHDSEGIALGVIDDDAKIRNASTILWLLLRLGGCLGRFLLIQLNRYISLSSRNL